MAESTGCRSFLASIAALFVSALLGGILALPIGLFNTEGTLVVIVAAAAAMGALIMPAALFAGLVGWFLLSLPWWLARHLSPALPELVKARAVVGFAGVAVPLSAGAALYWSAKLGAVPTVNLLEPILFGVAALPISVFTGLYARDGLAMLLHAYVKAP